MAGLKSYTTEVNGIQTTLRLSDADAKTRGLTADKPAAAADIPEDAPAQKAAPAPANKSRTAATNK
jgi:hypothetical protein